MTGDSVYVYYDEGSPLPWRTYVDGADGADGESFATEEEAAEAAQPRGPFADHDVTPSAV